MAKMNYVLTYVADRDIFNRFYNTFEEAWNVMYKELLEIPDVREVFDNHPEYKDKNGKPLLDIMEDGFSLYDDMAWCTDGWSTYDWKIDKIEQNGE